MAFMLIFLVTLAVLSALAVILDLKLRRRRAPGVDLGSRVRAVRTETEAKHGITPSGGGG